MWQKRVEPKSGTAHVGKCFPLHTTNYEFLITQGRKKILIYAAPFKPIYCSEVTEGLRIKELDLKKRLIGLQA